MGATGGRLAHTVANIQSLLAFRDVDALIIGEGEIVRVMEDAELLLDHKHRGYISVFALTGDAVVTLRGLKYSLTDYTMTSDYPIGVSNEFVGTESLVKAKGRVLIIYDRDTHSDVFAIDGLRG